MGFEPSDYTWQVGPEAARVFRDLRDRHGEAWYSEQKTAFRELLCEYFKTNEGRCNTPLGNTIRPCGGRDGGAALKVRWALPGGGKSGGLRLGVVVYVADSVVYIATASFRANDPTEDEIFGAVE